MHGCCASSQASATWPGVAPLAVGERADVVDERLVRARGSRRSNRGTRARISPAANVASASTVPVRNPLPSGLNGTNPMPSSAQRRQHLGLGVAGPQRVLALHRGHRDAPRARGGSCRPPASESPKCRTLPARDELADGAGDVLDRHVRVDAVLVEQVDRVDAEPLQRRRRRRGGSARAGVSMPCIRAVDDVPAELRRDDDLVADRRDRLADELLVDVRAVHLGGVDERDAVLDGVRAARRSCRRGRRGSVRSSCDMPMAPRPMAETSSPCPSVRVCMAVPLQRWGRPQWSPPSWREHLQPRRRTGSPVSAV